MSFNFDELQEIKNEFDNQDKKKNGGGANPDFLKNFVKLPQGNGFLMVRFLPPAPPGMFGRQVNQFKQHSRIHRINGRNIHCPREKKGRGWFGPCPICEHYSYTWKRSEKAKTEDEQKQLQALARTFRPSDRYYFNVIVRQQLNEETKQMENDVGPLILPAGAQILKILITGIFGDESANEAPLGDITHPVTGRDFKLVKKIQGGKTMPEYGGSKFCDPSPAGTPEQIERWMQNLHDLVPLRRLMSYDDMKIQLQKHLGVIPQYDTPVNYNPADYERPAGGPAATVRPDAAPSQTASQSAPSTTVEDVDASFDIGEIDELADEEFVGELGSMPS